MRASPRKRELALQSLQAHLDVYGAGDDLDQMRNPRAFLWRSLNRLGLRPLSDMLDLL